MKRTVAWTKFKLPNPNSHTDELDDDDDDDDDDSSWEIFEKKKYKDPVDRIESMISGNKILSTPLGSVNLDGSEETARLFNVWIAHTNFNLINQHYAAVEQVEGIEALQPISRYRFQVAIGFMFDENEVKKSVEEALIGSLLKDLKEVLYIYQMSNPTLTKTMTKTLESVVSGISNKVWVSYMPPGGDIKLVVGDSVDEDFFEEVTLLGLAQSIATGHIDSSLLREE